MVEKFALTGLPEPTAVGADGSGVSCRKLPGKRWQNRDDAALLCCTVFISRFRACPVDMLR